MKLTGICTVTLGSTKLRASKASIELGGYTRTPQFANGKLQGYTEEPTEATVTATLVHAKGDGIRAKIANAVDVTITFETDTGTQFVVTGAFCSTPPSVGSNGDGVDVEFKGNPADELE